VYGPFGINSVNIRAPRRGNTCPETDMILENQLLAISN